MLQGIAERVVVLQRGTERIVAGERVAEGVVVVKRRTECVAALQGGAERVAALESCPQGIAVGQRGTHFAVRQRGAECVAAQQRHHGRIVDDLLVDVALDEFRRVLVAELEITAVHLARFVTLRRGDRRRGHFIGTMREHVALVGDTHRDRDDCRRHCGDQYLLLRRHVCHFVAPRFVSVVDSCTPSDARRTPSNTVGAAESW